MKQKRLFIEVISDASIRSRRNRLIAREKYYVIIDINSKINHSELAKQEELEDPRHAYCGRVLVRREAQRLCRTEWEGACVELSSSNESSKRSMRAGDEISLTADAAVDDDPKSSSSSSGANVGRSSFTLLWFFFSTSLSSSSSKSSKSSSLVRVAVLVVPPPPPSPPRNKIGPKVRTANCISIWIFCSTS